MERLKRKKQKKQSRGVVKKSILRIVVLLLIIGLNWTGLLAIGRTLAYFSDTENTLGNTYQAGTLDFSLNTPGDFSLNLMPSGSVIRYVNVANQGSLLFQYIIERADSSGSLCDYLSVEAKLNGETKYTGNLNAFSLDPSILFSEPTDDWQFVFTFSEDQFEHMGEWCLFDFAFKGWQDNISDYESSGFKDEETAFTRITLRQEKTVVLNEILPDPAGEDCSLEGLQGEWVEIYNNGNIGQDLAEWYIKDSEDNTIVINSSNVMGGSTMIGPKDSGSEWLVVFLNDCILDNDGDAVFLYHSAGSLADSYSYFGIFPEDKSFARIPDGTGPWYDPIPTPGGPNVLDNKDDITFSELVEEFMDSNGGTEDLMEELEELEEPMDIEIITELEISTESELPEDNIIETTTPSTEEVIVIEEEPQDENYESGIMNYEFDETLANEPEQEEEIEEEIIQEEPVVEEELPIEEEPVVEEEPIIEEEEPVIEEPVEEPTSNFRGGSNRGPSARAIKRT